MTTLNFSTIVDCKLFLFGTTIPIINMFLYILYTKVLSGLLLLMVWSVSMSVRSYLMCEIFHHWWRSSKFLMNDVYNFIMPCIIVFGKCYIV